MVNLSNEAEILSAICIPDSRLMEYIEELLPMPEEPTDLQRNNIKTLRFNLQSRYFNAPDLQGMSTSGWRFINAVSDFVTHAAPLRRTANYQENLFAKTVDGNPMIDKAYELVKASA